jgi:Mrp family chromosome partitioning ATPase
MSPRRHPPRQRAKPPTPSRATWIAARARNALRRPLFIGTVSLITFTASLVALVVVPRQARRTAAELRPSASARPDTEPTATALAEAERQAATADSALIAGRTELAQYVAATTAATAADTMPSADPMSNLIRARRDSLNADIAQLGRLLARAENAPLLGAYRALAEAPAMRGNAQVKQLLDSLVEIEREREGYNAVGGVDPVFVALTARANELGRNIEALAEARRSDLRREIASLAPPPPSTSAGATARPLPDTLELLRAQQAARSAVAGVANRLARERTELARLDEREERARELSNLGASPTEMLAAALIFGAVIGFGFALVEEVRHPRIADGYEAERATGVRVLGVISPLPPSPERGRRSADRAAPPYIDPGADGHQLIYLHIATAGANVIMLTVTGDNPAVSAVVAVNFVAIAADEARSALLVDTDASASMVAAALRLRASEGLSGLVKQRLSWPEAIRSAKIGRESSIDVVTSGADAPPLAEVSALLERDATRLARRYDAIVLVSSIDQVLQGLPTALPIPDVVYCARAGHTSIAQLKRALEDIEDAGGRMRGIVLWNAPEPLLAEARPAEHQAEEARVAV